MYAGRLIDLIKGKLQNYTRLVLVGITLILIASLASNLIAIRRAGDKIEEAQERVNELEAEKSELEAQVEIVESEFYTELQLRDGLGLAKEGEIVVVLPEDELLRKLAPKLPEDEERLPDPNWKKWMNLFL